MTEIRRGIADQIVVAPTAAYEHALAVASLVHFNLKNPVDRFLLSYFATVIEITGACIALARNGELIGIPVLARTALEAHVDFACLHADHRYVDSIEASHDHQWSKVIDEATKNNNAYLAKLGAEPSVIAERAQIANRQDQRRQRGIRPLKTIERFYKAGLSDMYYSVYNFLCAEAHNDARALIGRHMHEDAEGGYSLTLYRDDPPHVESSLMQLHDSLGSMTEIICKRYDVSEPDRTAVDAAFHTAQEYIEAQADANR